MTFRKLLCPIDFSEGSDRAMRVAIRIANESGAELELVHVWYVPAATYGEYALSGAALQQSSDDAERLLSEAVSRAKALGARRVSGDVLTGIPWTTLVERASDPAIGLVIIGTHGRTGLARVFLGSVAEKVVRHAPCSVMAVRPDSEARPFEHVLCPTDFTDSARYATEIAATLVRKGGAGIALVHAHELPVSYHGEPFAAELYLELDRRTSVQLKQDAAELQRTLDIPVEARLRFGAAGAEILKALDEDRTLDLVVMGSHGRTGLRRALLGSVAEKVVRHAHCPVIVARKRSEGGKT